MKHNQFHAPSFYKSGKGLLRKLHGSHQKRDTTSSLLFSAFFRTAPTANDTTTVTIEKLFSNTIRLHELDPRSKTEWWRGNNKLRQQRLVQSEETFLNSTTPASNDGFVIGQNSILATHVLHNGTNQSTSIADNPDSATETVDNAYFPPVERLQNRQRRASSGGAT